MDVLRLLREHLFALRERFGVERIGVFGSFARGEHTDKSDVDVLVELRAGYRTFDNYMELKFYLEKLFGRDVDLITYPSIKPQLKEIIMREVVYA